MADREPVSEEPPLETVVGLLDDEYARAILAATRDDPMSAAELAERCDASLSTIGRRLDSLSEADLVRERTRPRPDGHHDTVYAATLAEFRLTLDGEGFEYALRRREEDVVDRFRRLWGDL